LGGGVADPGHARACQAVDMVKVLSTRGYSLPNLLKIKRHIWHNYQTIPPIPQPPTEMIPIITYFDRHHSCINRSWRSLIKSNPIFLPTRTISAFRKHKTLKNHLVRGRFTTPNPDHILDALITVMQQHTPSTPTPNHP